MGEKGYSMRTGGRECAFDGAYRIAQIALRRQMAVVDVGFCYSHVRVIVSVAIRSQLR